MDILSLPDRLAKVQQRIDTACQQTDRDPTDVTLLAVSKTKPASAVRQCYQQGQRHFGENYLQDAAAKIEQCRDLKDICWHFIGPLQSNKTRTVAEQFDWCETLDRRKIAQRLNDQRPVDKPPLNVLLQINISREPQKSGLLPEHLDEFAQWLSQLPQLRWRGLMCIPESTANQEHLAQQFDEMRQLMTQLQQHYPELDTLSMGMSGDMALAIEYGSTEVRIGTDIFGARQ